MTRRERSCVFIACGRSTFGVVLQGDPSVAGAYAVFMISSFLPHPRRCVSSHEDGVGKRLRIVAHEDAVADQYAVADQDAVPKNAAIGHARHPLRKEHFRRADHSSMAKRRISRPSEVSRGRLCVTYQYPVTD